jgi:hypothetical protein
MSSRAGPQTSISSSARTSSGPPQQGNCSQPNRAFAMQSVWWPSERSDRVLSSVWYLGKANGGETVAGGKAGETLRRASAAKTQELGRDFGRDGSVVRADPPTVANYCRQLNEIVAGIAAECREPKHAGVARQIDPRRPPESANDLEARLEATLRAIQKTPVKSAADILALADAIGIYAERVGEHARGLVFLVRALVVGLRRVLRRTGSVGVDDRASGPWPVLAAGKRVATKTRPRV